MDSLIKVENLTFSYGEKKILDNISLDVYKGEFLAVIGYNGSGKSTLAKLMNGILLPVSGKVFVEGMDTSDESLTADIRKKVGMVFQNPDNQIVATIVEEDVAFAPENLGLEPEIIDELVTSSIDTVGMTKHRLDSPHKLSGGQKQRVAIAGVLAMRPDCIILDEPTAMLDPKGREMVMGVIEKLHGEGYTVILITHFMEEAARADRIMVLSEGKPVLCDTPSKVFKNYDMLYKLGLDVPQANELCHELNKLDKAAPDNSISNAQCIEEVAAYLSGGKG